MLKLSSVLLADDDATTNYLNKAIIRRLGITERLLVATNGREALDHLPELSALATADCPALIVLDMNMPVLNGFEFLAAYQLLPLARRQAVVVVVLTTSMLPRDLERVRQLPVADILHKPLTKEMVEQVLARYFPG